MKQIENTLQDLKCMLIEDGYTESNVVMRTLIKAQEQVKNCSIPDVSQQRELLIAYEKTVGSMDINEVEKEVGEYLKNKGN